jgi:hypothetical protein
VKERLLTVRDLRRALATFDNDTEIVVSFSTKFKGDDLHVIGRLAGLSLEVPRDASKGNFLRLTASDQEGDDG